VRLSDRERDITLVATDDALDFICRSATEGNAEYGARPVTRWIERNIVTELSKLIIRGSLQPHQLCKLDVKTNMDGQQELAYNISHKPPPIPVPMAVDSTTTGGKKGAGLSNDKKRNAGALKRDGDKRTYSDGHKMEI